MIAFLTLFFYMTKCVHCEEIAEKLQKHTETIERQNDAIMQILAEHKILLDRLLSQNVAVTTILNIFPINSEEKLSELNEMLSAQSIIYIKHLKTLLKGNVEKNLSEILATEIIMNFNVEGTFGKKRLRKYENVYAALIGLTMCYQRLSVNNNNHNNLDQKPTHLPPLHYPHGHRWNEPYFDLTMPKNITSLVGKSAYLGCRVKHLGNKTVAWIRHRDLHILTVGTYTYTTDQRFQTSYHRDIDEWTLQIKWAQQRDAGVYECQISTQPVRSFSVNLNIVDTIDTEKNSLLQQYYNDDAFYIGADRVYQTNDDEFAGMFGPIQTIAVPTATILGGPDLYVDKGSTINLTCAIKFSPEPPTHIFWYHQDKVLSEETSGGRITFKTIKSEETKSILLINDADLLDSGKYSCYPSNTEIASIRVHVLQGERPEAMQTNAATTATMHAAMLQPSKFIGAIISLVGLSQIYAIFSQIQQNYRINRNAELLSRANKQRDERITRNIKATLFDGEYGQRDYSESATASSQNYSNYNNNNNNLHKNKRTVTR